MEERIIPFGKYKGKPVDILATDKKYMDWLMAQIWFMKNHVSLYKIVINNFREPVDTAEHNKIQIKFLDLEYRLKLAYLLDSGLFEYNSDKINGEIKEFLRSINPDQKKYFIKELSNRLENVKQASGNIPLLAVSTPTFEIVDVIYQVKYGMSLNYDYGYMNGKPGVFHKTKSMSVSIEIKPVVCEDYPAILRQMKASMPVRNRHREDEKYVLLIGEYTGQSASKEELIKYFKTQGYIVIFESEITNLSIPQIDRELILDEEIKEELTRNKNEDDSSKCKPVINASDLVSLNGYSG